MKICYDARSAQWYAGTGIGTYTGRLLEALARLRAADFRLVWADRCDLRLAGPGEEPSSPPLAPEPLPEFWDLIAVPIQDLGNSFDVLHVPHNGLGLPARKECAWVVTIHDLIPFRLPGSAETCYARYFREQVPAAVARADVVITVSEQSRRDLQDLLRVPDEKIVVTYEAADPSYHPRDYRAARRAVSGRYGIDHPYLLYIGGFAFRKNLVRLVRAFAAVADQFPDHLLVIVGRTGRSYPLVRETAQSLGILSRVVFPGQVSAADLPTLYCGADLFVYPSLYEGFGLPPLEALASGVPTIVSRSSSLPEVVGEAALLFDPLDQEELIDCMGRVLADRDIQARLRQGGPVRAAGFSWDQTAAGTLAAYRTAAGLDATGRR